MNPRSFSVPSFAKINWRLEILGKRHDGYHELRTIFQTISLHDVIHFAWSGDGAITLECDNKEIPTDSRNLVVRAANALTTHSRVQAGVHIRLEKRIPAKGGLGGGSSNAAIALVALADLWQLEIDLPTLMKLAANLGADVPFFLTGGTALGTGKGSTISQLSDDPLQHLIIITPNAEVSSSDAYTAMNCGALTTLGADSILSSSPSGQNFSELKQSADSRYLNNDFENVIFDMEPEISRSKEALLQAGASDALLAGSGSSVFGLFPDAEAQKRALDKIQLEEGWRVFPCDTLSRKEYISALTGGRISLARFFNSDSDIGA